MLSSVLREIVLFITGQARGRKNTAHWNCLLKFVCSVMFFLASLVLVELSPAFFLPFHASWADYIMLTAVFHYLHLMLNSVCGKQGSLMVCTIYTKEKTALCSIMIAMALKLKLWHLNYVQCLRVLLWVFILLLVTWEYCSITSYTTSYSPRWFSVLKDL